MSSIDVIKMIQDATNDGCTEIEALELAIELLKVEVIKKKLPTIDKHEAFKIAIAVSDIDDMQRAMYEQLTMLSRREKQCYLMHHVSLMSMQQIADEIGVSKSAVQCYLDRAKEKLNA